MRPPNLLDARDAVKAGKLPREAIVEIEDRCILATLERQRDIGVAVFSDGEMRRDAWQTVFSEAVDGFDDAYPIHTFERGDGTTAQLQMHTNWW